MINLSDTTPAAPAGNTNVKWQKDSSGSVSAYTGGSLFLLESHAASTSAELDFTAWYSAAYDDYLVEIVNLIPGTNAVSLELQCSTNAGASYDTGTNYSTAGHYFYSGGSGFATSGSDSAGAIILADTIGNTADWAVSGSFRMFNPASTALYKQVAGGPTTFFQSTLSKMAAAHFAGAYKSLLAVNAFRLLFSSGTITSGTVRVYGIGH